MTNFLQAGRGESASRVNGRWDLFMARGCGSAGSPFVKTLRGTQRLALPDNNKIFLTRDGNSYE